MSKIVISRLFLYKHRFIIGYIIIGLIFTSLLFLLPFTAQTGISKAEMESATISYNLAPESIFSNSLVDFPYHILQKISLIIFGLTPFAIKLPSIIVGFFLALLFILILNRWFKNNVSLLASVFVIFSTTFLFLAGFGAPLIMIVFWPALLLWLGSKIQGKKHPKSSYCFAFIVAMIFSLFTPYMIYFAIFCAFFVLIQPHLRFAIKRLPRIPFIIMSALGVLVLTLLVLNFFNYPSAFKEILFASDFHAGEFFNNIASAYQLIFSWDNSISSTFLTPLISLPVFAIALVGLFSTTKGFFASRNSIATVLLVFATIIAGFNKNAMFFIILPFSILVAHGIRYILNQWYGLFPENPYARVFAFIPLSILIGLIIIPGFTQYIESYHYNPTVANEFTNNLSIIRKHLVDETMLLEPKSLEYNFYRILENSTNIRVIDSVEFITDNTTIATLSPANNLPENYTFYRLITSEKSDNSDIIYLYKKEGE